MPILTFGTGRTLLNAGRTRFALDLFPGAVTAAYGVRRLRRSYSGPCLRLRRTNDNAEMDFGFNSDNLLDVAAIAAWQSNDALLRTITQYDLNGTGKDITNGSAPNQPGFSFTALGAFGGPKFVAASSTSLGRAQDVLPTGAAPCTILTVSKRQALDVTETIVSVGANAAGQRPTLQSNTSQRALASYSGGVATAAINTWPVATGKAVAGRWDNVNNQVMVGGAVTSAAATALNIGATEFALGKNAGIASGFWNDAILECIVVADATIDWAGLQLNQERAFAL